MSDKVTVQEIRDLLDLELHSYADIADILDIDESVVREVSYFHVVPSQLYGEECLPEYDDPMADVMEMGYEDHLSAWDDDPNPYDGTYSEM